MRTHIHSSMRTLDIQQYEDDIQQYEDTYTAVCGRKIYSCMRTHTQQHEDTHTQQYEDARYTAV
jgi:hypothetical protein